MIFSFCFSFHSQMARQCLQTNLAWISRLFMFILYNKFFIQIRFYRIPTKVSWKWLHVKISLSIELFVKFYLEYFIKYVHTLVNKVKVYPCPSFWVSMWVWWWNDGGNNTDSCHGPTPWPYSSVQLYQIQMEA